MMCPDGWPGWACSKSYVQSISIWELENGIAQGSLKFLMKYGLQAYLQLRVKLIDTKAMSKHQRRKLFYDKCTWSIKRFTTRLELSIVVISWNFFKQISGIIARSGKDIWWLHWAKCTESSSIADKTHCSWKFLDFNQCFWSCTKSSIRIIFLTQKSYLDIISECQPPT